MEEEKGKATDKLSAVVRPQPKTKKASRRGAETAARPWPQPKSPSFFREGLGEGFELGTRVSPSPSPSPQGCLAESTVATLRGGGLIEKMRAQCAQIERLQCKVKGLAISVTAHRKKAADERR